MTLYSKLIHWLARDIIYDLKVQNRTKMSALRKEIMWELQMPPRLMKEDNPWPKDCLFVGGHANGKRISSDGYPVMEVPVLEKLKATVMSGEESPLTFCTMEHEEYVRETIECQDSDDKTVRRIFWYRFKGISRYNAIEKLFISYPFPPKR